jgi:hypothetical protein
MRMTLLAVADAADALLGASVRMFWKAMRGRGGMTPPASSAPARSAHATAAAEARMVCV